MKVTLNSTSQIVMIETRNGNVSARVWEGVTERGVTTQALIVRLAVHRYDDNSQFEQELIEVEHNTPTFHAFSAGTVL